jgi:hypothetical protein
MHHGGIANVVGRGDFDQVHTQHPPLSNQAVYQLADLYSTQPARRLRHYRVRQKKGPVTIEFHSRLSPAPLL